MSEGVACAETCPVSCSALRGWLSEGGQTEEEAGGTGILGMSCGELCSGWLMYRVLFECSGGEEGDGRLGRGGGY